MDLNGDGNLDIAVGNIVSDNVSVLLGDGQGGFGFSTEFAVDVGPYAVAIADCNSDGKPDLLTSNVGGNSVSLLLGNGMGGFGTATNFSVGAEPYALAVADA